MALSGAKALSLHARNEPAVVSLPIQRRKDIDSDRIRRRADPISLPFHVQVMNAKFFTSFSKVQVAAKSPQLTDIGIRRATFSLRYNSGYTSAGDISFSGYETQLSFRISMELFKLRGRNFYNL